MRREGLQQRQCGKRVQAIALCKKLGLTYSTTTNFPAPRKQKRLKKPPTPPGIAATTAVTVAGVSHSPGPPQHVGSRQCGVSGTAWVAQAGKVPPRPVRAQCAGEGSASRCRGVPRLPAPLWSAGSDVRSTALAGGTASCSGSGPAPVGDKGGNILVRGSVRDVQAAARHGAPLLGCQAPARSAR